MKKLILAIVACLGLASCVMEDTAYAQVPVRVGTVEVCDDFGCRLVNSQYYYDSAGVLFYYDVHFGCWIGPGHGYWYGNHFYRGYYPGYHGFYHRGFYGGFHGGFHGGHR